MVETVLLEKWDKPADKSVFDMPPNHWTKHQDVIFVSCPMPKGKGKAQTDHISHLPHEILSSGKVRPSLQCPYQGCPWHVFAILNNWETIRG